MLRDRIWECNLKESDADSAVAVNCDEFWKDVLSGWCKVNFVQNIKNPGEQVIWFNSHICMQQKPFVWEEVYKNGLVKVSQLYEGNRIKGIGALEFFLMKTYSVEFHRILQNVKHELGSK